MKDTQSIADKARDDEMDQVIGQAIKAFIRIEERASKMCNEPKQLRWVTDNIVRIYCAQLTADAVDYLPYANHVGGAT